MANEVLGIGTTVKRWDGAAWDLIGNLTAISGPGYSKDTLETTDLSTADGFRTFMAGLKDAGEVSLTLNYSTTEWAALMADFESASNVWYGIELPDSAGTSLEFSGIVTAVPLEIPMDEKITSEITIKISGKPTIGTALSADPTA